MQLFTQLLTARNCSLDTPAPLMRPGCQTFAAERCKLLLITSTQISSIHPQYGPSLRTRIVIISRHVRSRGVDELKMLLLMPQKFNIPTLKIRCLLETLGEVFDR